MTHDQQEKFNLELFRKLGTKRSDGLGILGLTVSEEYGGAGLDPLSVVIAHEELSYSDPAFCLSYLAHSILFVHNLFINGSDEQRRRWLPGACDGTKVGGMCMSEPSVGTDVLGMSSRAQYDEGIEAFILNGTKMWITNGTVDGGATTGDIFLVYAKTGTKRTDITQFVVEKDMPGFSVGQKISNKCGMRASNTTELIFEDVVLPRETHVVGEVNGATMCMMRNLEIERLALASMSLGIARRCVDEMVKYGQERKAFGKELHEFGQIQNFVSTSYAEYMAGKYSMQLPRFPFEEDWAL
jgi:isovaleryl-CoA dehydrogenase